MAAKPKVVSAKIDTALFRKIEDIKRSRGCTRNEIIRDALLMYVRQNKGIQ